MLARVLTTTTTKQKTSRALFSSFMDLQGITDYQLTLEILFQNWVEGEGKDTFLLNSSKFQYNITVSWID